jgi:hypothetical protein
MANALKIGSLEHKELLCRTFIDTHDPFKPTEIRWPDLDAETLARLKAMPVWNEATRTEAATAVKVQSLGDIEKDPLLAQAISLQGYEEARHAEVLQLLARHYGIQVDDHPAPEVPANPTRAFLRTGYGECMDSFFAFGLFRMGEKAQYFPKALVEVFETIMQEEARHILFIVNWAAYLRARRPVLARPAFDVWRGWNVVAQALGRVKGALAMTGGGGEKGKEKHGGKPASAEPADAKGIDNSKAGFTMGAASFFSDFSLRAFLELCLAENDRRLSLYDPRLLRPTMVPSVIRRVVKVLPRRGPSPRRPSSEEKAA